MIKYISLTLLFVSVSLASQAQHIADAAFAAAIRVQCAACIDANNDLTAAAAAVQNLDISAQGISNLNGIAGFTNLENLDCSFNQLSLLPALPLTLIGLSTVNNQLITLPNLPTGLKYLLVSQNQLTSLPVLPQNLESLSCYTNNLSVLPALPPHLLTLNCWGNALLTLPALPSVMKTLDCSNNSITVLPDLPNSIQNLSVQSNNLTVLPQLPNSLNRLYAFDNQLTALPKLPQNIDLMYCYGNPLTTLPTLPNSLTALWAYQTLLTDIPVLPPFLVVLRLYNTPSLRCIGVLPNTLTDLQIYNTNITCLPNIPTLITTNLPVCTQTTNTNACFIPPIVSGTVFFDKNNNAIQDSTEYGIPNTLVKNTTGIGGQFIAATDSLGRYVGTAELNTVTVLSVDSISSAFTTTPWLHSINTVDTAYQHFYNRNFAYRALRSEDSIQVHIHTSTLVPNDTSVCYLFYKNIGTTILSGNIILYKSPKLQYNGANIPLVVQSSINSLQFNFTNLHPLLTQSISVKLSTPDNPTLIGDTIQNKVRAYGVGDTTNRRLSLRDGGGGGTVDEDVEITTIRGSHDPNHKIAQINTITPLEIQQDKAIEYTINFENTGTYFAKWVIVEDTLDSNLDWRSLRIVANSHKCSMVAAFDTTRNDAPVVIKWVFPNINLLWRDSSQTSCTGFIKFAIKAKSNLNIGTIIRNTAHIYFDTNPNIPTNTYAITVQMPLTNQNLSKEDIGLKIYPTVTNDKINIASTAPLPPQTVLNIYNSIGQKIYTSILNPNETLQEVSLGHLASGIYTAVLTANQRITPTKIVLMSAH
jgi:uncharacterized repeat protein (TIGR01451 family)